MVADLVSLEEQIFALTDEGTQFDQAAKRIVEFQQHRNTVYRKFCAEMGIPDAHLPVEAFRLAPVTCFDHEAAERVFVSSGTSGTERSRHYVHKEAVYRESVVTHFASVFGPQAAIIVGHLPGYGERGKSSSLVAMVEYLIEAFGATGSGFFLNNDAVLGKAVAESNQSENRLVLFGSAFGLLDLLDRGAMRLPATSVVIETGGMKMRRREIERESLHVQLSNGFGIRRQQVFSEYGMCEMLSQFYTRGDRVLYPPPWVRFEVVDVDDPSAAVRSGEVGLLAITDLANMYSAARLLTNDLAVRRGSGFEVLGRNREAGLRGCNFLLEEAAPKKSE